MEMLTQDRLRRLVRYSPDTGVFIRNESTSGHVKAGAIAGTLTSEGALQFWVDGRAYFAHRLAFLYMTGKWPVGIVDHADLNKSNNAWTNLRDATFRQNCANKGVSKNNKLRLKGVNFDRGAYRAQIGFDNKMIYLGRFPCPAAASIAYQIKADQLFGNFARHL